MTISKTTIPSTDTEPGPQPCGADPLMYFATTTDRRGRKRQHAVAETRATAARLVFEADPKASHCSTSKAHRQSDGQLWDTGSAMIWYRRGEVAS